MASTHPFLRPTSVHHEPHNPVRDDAKLSPTEDLDRQPDGVLSRWRQVASAMTP
jgi:hypothetical protein